MLRAKLENAVMDTLQSILVEPWFGLLDFALDAPLHAFTLIAVLAVLVGLIVTLG